MNVRLGKGRKIFYFWVDINFLWSRFDFRCFNSTFFNGLIFNRFGLNLDIFISNFSWGFYRIIGSLGSLFQNFLLNDKIPIQVRLLRLYFNRFKRYISDWYGSLWGYSSGFF